MTEKEIEILADKIIVRVPNVKPFGMGYEIDQYFKSINSETIVNNEIMESVIDFMREQQYIEDRSGHTSEILTPKGIEVKELGGHFKYLESKEKAKEREHKKDEILDLELTLRQFESKIGRKIIIGGFIISILSFVISFTTIKVWGSENNTIPISQEDAQPLHIEQEILSDTL